MLEVFNENWDSEKAKSVSETTNNNQVPAVESNTNNNPLVSNNNSSKTEGLLVKNGSKNNLTTSREEDEEEENYSEGESSNNSGSDDAAQILDSSILALFRVGIGTGPVVAGPLGTMSIESSSENNSEMKSQRLPGRYRLFGDTVNVAARMKQTALPNAVQFTEETRKYLPSGACKYAFNKRRNIKGKGVMNTYNLIQIGNHSLPPAWAGFRDFHDLHCVATKATKRCVPAVVNKNYSTWGDSTNNNSHSHATSCEGGTAAAEGQAVVKAMVGGGEEEEEKSGGGGEVQQGTTTTVGGGSETVVVKNTWGGVNNDNRKIPLVGPLGDNNYLENQSKGGDKYAAKQQLPRQLSQSAKSSMVSPFSEEERSPGGRSLHRTLSTASDERGNHRGGVGVNHDFDVGTNINRPNNTYSANIMNNPHSSTQNNYSTQRMGNNIVGENNYCTGRNAIAGKDFGQVLSLLVGGTTTSALEVMEDNGNNVKKASPSGQLLPDAVQSLLDNHPLSETEGGQKWLSQVVWPRIRRACKKAVMTILLEKNNIHSAISATSCSGSSKESPSPSSDPCSFAFTGFSSIIAAGEDGKTREAEKTQDAFSAIPFRECNSLQNGNQHRFYTLVVSKTREAILENAKQSPKGGNEEHMEKFRLRLNFLEKMFEDDRCTSSVVMAEINRMRYSVENFF